MDKKYRIKLLKNFCNPQNNEFSVESPLKLKKNENVQFQQLTPKRSKSELVISQQQASMNIKEKLKKQMLSQSRHIYSKLHPLSHSIQQKRQNRTRSITVPQKYSDYCEDSINILSPNSQSKNANTEIHKFPHYVSKSNQMVETKQKLLQLKHRIKFNCQSPLLQSIENSINVDRAGFTRKMKVQLCKKGNTSLMDHFQKDITQFQDSQSLSKNKSKEKQYRPIDLPYLKAIQSRDQNVYENYQRMQKMQELKRNLKAVRKSNLKHRK